MTTVHSKRDLQTHGHSAHLRRSSGDFTMMMSRAELSTALEALGPIAVGRTSQLNAQVEPAKSSRRRRFGWLAAVGTVAVAGAVVLSGAVGNRSPDPQNVVAGENAQTAPTVKAIAQSNWLPPVANLCPLPPQGTHCTAVEFVCSPAEASQQAAEQHKLVFLLHVSGDFDDPGFT